MARLRNRLGRNTKGGVARTKLLKDPTLRFEMDKKLYDRHDKRSVITGTHKQARDKVSKRSRQMVGESSFTKWTAAGRKKRATLATAAREMRRKTGPAKNRKGQATKLTAVGRVRRKLAYTRLVQKADTARKPITSEQITGTLQSVKAGKSKHRSRSPIKKKK